MVYIETSLFTIYSIEYFKLNVIITHFFALWQTFQVLVKLRIENIKILFNIQTSKNLIVAVATNLGYGSCYLYFENSKYKSNSRVQT